MKKNIILATLLLVLLKFTYNIVAFIYDTQDPLLETYFRYSLFLIIMYYGFTSLKKKGQKL